MDLELTLEVQLNTMSVNLLVNAMDLEPYVKVRDTYGSVNLLVNAMDLEQGCQSLRI